MNLRYPIEGANFSRAGYASSEVKKVLKQLNIDSKIIKRAVVALYEAEVNIVAHATNGEMIVDIDKDRIKVNLIDEGPGIEDVEKAMTEGFSTASEKVRQMGFGAGMGLPNIKKNVDNLNITTKVGEGTELELTINLVSE